MGVARAEIEMRRRVASGQVAGVATAVVTGDEVVEACYGLLDVERKVPVRPDSLMRVYSMTKPMIGVAVMLLQERGLLKLDDRVREWIPAFGELVVASPGVASYEALATDVTVLHLLTHTSGLAYGFQEGEHEDRYRAAGLLSPILRLNYPLSTLVDRITNLPLGFQPGTCWHYSIAFDVVGHLIELVTGRSLGDFLAEEIFIPLGMVDTGFSVPATAMDRFGPLYSPPEDGAFPVVDPATGSPFTDAHLPESGGGGLVSTLRDYLRFIRMLSGGGRLADVRILQPTSVHAMITNQLQGGAFPVRWDEGPDDTMGYGLGLGVGVAEPAKFGWGGASGGLMWVFPDRDQITLSMTQSFVDFSTSDAFVNAVIAAD